MSESRSPLTVAGAVGFGQGPSCSHAGKIPAPGTALGCATAARASGLTDRRIIFRHILPNALTPVFVAATFDVAGAILTESALSFLGFGVPPPTASWGEVLKQSQSYVDFAWWLVLFPGIAVFVTVVGFNLVGDGLRDAMDPRLRQ